MRSPLAQLLIIQEEPDGVELARIEAQALRFAQPAAELTIHIGLGADDRVTPIVTNRHRRLSTG